MKSAQEYLDETPSGATTKGFYKGSEMIEAINRARRQVLLQAAQIATDDGAFETSNKILNLINELK